LAALAGVGATTAAERIRRKEWRAFAPSLALAAAACAFAALSFPAYRREAPNNYALLAEMQQERGDYDGARRLLNDALTRMPQEASLLCAMGKVCLRTRDAAGALDYTGRCVRANPAIMDGWYLRGMAYEANGDAAHAREAYREQLRRVPGHEGARRRLGD
jgi:tetratricopeptide (TPR) repeat protein